MKKTFTILHTNDMHSNFIGMGPASDYTPFTLNDDKTRGGYARLVAMIAARRKARSGEGPVLTLDAGDYSMGTAFAAASREIGGDLQMFQFAAGDRRFQILHKLERTATSHCAVRLSLSS